MKLYRIDKGNLLKARQVFRQGNTVELSDAEAGRFRAGGGELAEAVAASEAEGSGATDDAGTKARRGR